MRWELMGATAPTRELKTPPEKRAYDQAHSKALIAARAAGITDSKVAHAMAREAGSKARQACKNKMEAPAPEKGVAAKAKAVAKAPPVLKKPVTKKPAKK